MTPLHLLIIYSSPSVAPLKDLLRAIQAQGLLKDFYMLELEDSVVDSSEPVEEPVEEALANLRRQPVERFSWVPSSFDAQTLREFQEIAESDSEYVVTNVVLADSFGATYDKQLFERFSLKTERVLQALETPLPLKSGKIQQINLRKRVVVVPADKQKSIPKVFEKFQSDESPEPWKNIIVIPETQSRCGLPLLPVENDEAYIAHAAVSILGVAGLWRTDENVELNFNEGLGDKCVSVRTKARLVIAPELPAQVFSRAFRRAPLVPLSADQNEFCPVPTGNAIELMRRCEEEISNKNGISTPDVSEISEVLSPRHVVSIKEFLRILWFWLTIRLKHIVVEDVKGLLDEAESWAKKRLDEFFGGEGSKYGTTSGERSEVAGLGSAYDLVVSRIPPQPELWSSIRQTMLGLIDGSRLPYNSEIFRNSGSSKYVITDRSMIVVTPNAVPDQTVNTVMGRFRKRFVLIGQECADLMAQIESALEEERLAQEEEDKEREKLRARGFFKRVVSWILKRVFKFAVFVLAAFALVVLPFLIPVAALVTIAWAFIGGFLLLFSVLRGLKRYLQKKYLEDMRRSVIREKSTVLKHIHTVLDTQKRRMESLESISIEWEEILAKVVHEPFGPLQKNPNPRVRNFDLMLPLSHQIVEPTVSEAQLQGLVAFVRREYYKSGWLVEKYDTILNSVKGRFETLNQEIAFEPERSDASLEGSLSHRQFLSTEIRNGDVIREASLEDRKKVHEYLTTRSGTWSRKSLIPNTGIIPRRRSAKGLVSLDVDEFLSELNVKKEEIALSNRLMVDPAQNYEFDLHLVQIEPTSVRQDDLTGIDRQDWNPDLGSLIFGTVSYEQFVVQNRDIKMFGDDPVAAVLDLSRAIDIWKLPPDDEFDLLPPTDDEDLEPKDVPHIPETPKDEDSTVIIRPQKELVVPTETGPYSFLAEFDGTPACWVRRDAEPIKWRLRSKAGPENAYEIVTAALQSVANVTGLSFRFAGTFAQVPDFDVRGDSIDIGWATRSEFSVVSAKNGKSSNSVIGWGGPTNFVPNGDGDPVIVGGTVVLNAAMACETRIGPGSTHYMVLLHELGHVMNLGHVQSALELMYPFIGNQAGWGPGDRRGLLVLAKNS